MLDTKDMLGAALSLPEQLEAARLVVGDVAIGSAPTSVVVVGTGAGALAGDIVAATVVDSPVPIIVSRSGECAGFVGPSVLVVAVSSSGNSGDTLEVAREAAARGATVVAVCAGGALAAFAHDIGAPVVEVAPTVAASRSAVGSLATAVLVLLGQLGLTSAVDEHVDSAVAQLRRRRGQVGSDTDPVPGIARRVGRTFPIIYGAGPLGAVGASRWKTQFNENPKVPAFANWVPELARNEVSGWAQHGDVTRQVFTLVLVRHSFESAKDAVRIGAVSELCDEVVAGVIEVEAAGATRFAQLMDLVLMADLVTLRCAANEGVDPGPVPAVDEVERRVAAM